MSNSSFSKDIPLLQIAWDSTSLSALKECPRKYKYSIIDGWAPRNESVHLTFGALYHSALERYDHLLVQGKSHDEAVPTVVRWLLNETWNRELNRPWLSDDKNKNRYTLVRTVVWYLDQFKSDPLQTVILADGKPAVELSFRMEFGFTSSLTSEPYLLCGHLDRLAELNGATYIVDRKTSKNTIGEDFFSKFSPDNQFSTYCFGAKVVYALPTQGLIVDAAQVAMTFSRYQRGFVFRTEDQLLEWYEDAKILLAQNEYYVQRDYWPMNDKSCNNYGGCPFRFICAKAPSVREQWLKASYTQRVWDPLQIRGDI